MKYNKRGVSAVIATVLIILITVAAVTIIWAFIIPFLTGTMTESTACLSSTGQLTLKEDYSCKVGNNLSVQVSRGENDFSLEDIQVLVTAKGNTKSFSILSATTLNPAGAEKSDLPNALEDRVFVINVTGITNIENVQVAPVIRVENNLKTCGKSPALVVEDC